MSVLSMCTIYDVYNLYLCTIYASKQFFEGLRTVYSPPSSTVTPIRDYEGNLLTAKASILEHWAKHFKTLLNRPSIIQDQVIDDIPQCSLINLLDESPTLAEAKKAVDQLQSGKAPGPDGIPYEIFKSGAYALLVRLTNFFQWCWDNGELPQDLKDAYKL